jgi:hypothetical protein
MNKKLKYSIWLLKKALKEKHRSLYKNYIYIITAFQYNKIYKHLSRKVIFYSRLLIYYIKIRLIIIF